MTFSNWKKADLARIEHRRYNEHSLRSEYIEYEDQDQLHRALCDRIDYEPGFQAFRVQINGIWKFVTCEYIREDGIGSIEILTKN